MPSVSVLDLSPGANELIVMTDLHDAADRTSACELPPGAYRLEPREAPVAVAGT